MGRRIKGCSQYLVLAYTFLPRGHWRPKLGLNLDPHGVNEGLAGQVTWRGEAADPQRVWVRPSATGMGGVGMLVSVASRHSRGRTKSLFGRVMGQSLDEAKGAMSGHDLGMGSYRSPTHHTSRGLPLSDSTTFKHASSSVSVDQRLYLDSYTS